MTPLPRRRLIFVLVAAAAALCVLAPAAGARPLRGTFTLAPGHFAHGKAGGSYFRMLFPGGGHFFENPDSKASNKTYTLLQPGSAGGLVAGRYQPHPHTAFDRIGNSKAASIIRPTKFAAIRFGLATLPKDPQSHRSVPAPAFTVSGRRISGQVQALTAEWNKLYFNQGSPKPGASSPRVSGRYNPRTHAYLITWKSLIRSGPFNGFTGVWHLQGRVRGAGAAAAVAAAKKKHHCPKGKRWSTKAKKCVKKKHKKPTVVPVYPPSGEPLVGTFRLTTGTWGSNGATGSYFRMIFLGGNVANGPFFNNPSSAAPDKSYTLISAGTDGGLTTGAYQDPPTPAFTAGGNALATKIITPQRFAGVNFSLSTSPLDKQTGLAVPAPSVSNDAGKLGGNLQAFTASWNRNWFNQGSPKPNGKLPAITTPVTGTYDASTKAFVLEWSSAIVGGPFNGFGGYWHLQGTFEPRG